MLLSGFTNKKIVQQTKFFKQFVTSTNQREIELNFGGVDHIRTIFVYIVK